jgi:hypothetical protein
VETSGRYEWVAEKGGWNVGERFPRIVLSDKCSDNFVVFVVGRQPCRFGPFKPYSPYKDRLEFATTNKRQNASLFLPDFIIMF